MESVSERRAAATSPTRAAPIALADLLLENGKPAEALKEYEAVLKTAPRRFNALAGAGRAADKADDQAKARAYAMQLRETAHKAETARPELEWVRAFLGIK